MIGLERRISSRHDSKVQLDEQTQGDKDFENHGRHPDSLSMGKHPRYHKSIIKNSKNTAGKESTCTYFMPMFLHSARIDQSSTPEESQDTGDAEKENDFRFVLANIEDMLPTYCLHPEVVVEVGQNYQHTIADSADPEDQKLGVMLGSFADPCVR